MNEEYQIRHFVVPPDSEEQFHEEFGGLIGDEVLFYNVKKVSLGRFCSKQGIETVGMALTFGGETEPGPSVVCSLPLSMAKAVRDSLDNLLPNEPSSQHS